MASSEKDKLAAGMLRQGLASQAGAADACPDPEILAAYSENSLDADEAARYELHFSQCARCREQLAVMSLSAVATPAPVSHFKWVWPWTWFVLAPVTTALLIAFVVIVRRPVQRQSAENASPSLVAMSQPSQQPMASGALAPNAEMIAKPAPAPQSVPAARVPPPSAPVAGGALRRTAPNSALAKLQDVQPEPSPALEGKVAEKKEDAGAVTNLPLTSRNYTQLDTVTKSASPAKQTGSDSTGHGKGVGSASDSVVVVTSAAPLISTAAPVSQGLTDRTTADARVNSVGPESARAKQVPAPALVNGAGTLSQSVMVEAAADRNALTLVRSPDPQVLWRVSSGRVVDRSSDAGATWREQWTNASAHVVAGAAPSVDTCWLVGRGGIVLLTTDGRNWKTIAPPTAADFVNVSATDASSATVTASDGRQFKTSDGGKHWNPAP
jgi:Photosynthesis system II assembly factor YCF48